MKKLNNDIKYLIFIWIVLFVGITTTFAHHGDLVIDCGREVYYPTQILLGKILYKDLFNIYGPFSYMFNALLFKVFGTNLNVLYLAGSVCAFFITTLIYQISRRFLSSFLSFSIAIFTIAAGVLNLGVFNYIFPYSYGILYGLTAFLTSVWLLLKYHEKPEKTYFLYLSSFFAGLCISNKYEFLPYFLVILYAMIKIKKLNFKEYYYAIFSLLFAPIFCFGILFLQGLNINDLTSTALILNKMSHSQTLSYFYKHMGFYFSIITIPLWLGSFSFVAFTLICFIKGFKQGLANKILLTLSIIFLYIFIALKMDGLIFAFLPLFITFMTIWKFKVIKENIPLLILAFSAILFGLKVFTGLLVYNYGAFFAPFLLVTAVVLTVNIYKKEEINQKAIAIYILIIASFLGYKNLDSNKFKTQPVKTAYGKIYDIASKTDATKELITYINTNTKKSDTIAVFPEGPMINFLTNRKTDDYYNSLIPLYVEVFGEEKLINHFKKTKPEYIIFNNWDTGEYYFKHICQDYAVSFCNYVAMNYTQEKVIDTGFRYLIFKKK